MVARDDFGANPFSAPETDLSGDEDRVPDGEVVYATFGARWAAAFLDGLILLIPGFILGLMVGLALSQTNSPALIQVVSQLVGGAMGWLYSALQESSEAQATVGKKAMGIKVTDLNGGRISFGQATGRHFGKLISTIILLIGYLMQPFTQKKQALHDIMAGTLVVKVKR